MPTYLSIIAAESAVDIGVETDDIHAEGPGDLEGDDDVDE
jgi:hypothetical protein